MIAAYYRLCKPGIVYSNALTALAAYLFAAQDGPSIATAIALILGLSFSIAGAAVLNNVIEKDVDARMDRTKSRAIPSGVISSRDALIFAALLSLAGLGILLLHVSTLVAALVAAGMVIYVAIYTPAKRFTRHSTLIGSLSGAVPPVAGYAAGAHALDLTALLLLLALCSWQMTHFFAIGLFRTDDYRNAGLPILPTLVPSSTIKHWMLFYAAAFAIVVAALGYVHGASLWYWLIMAPVTLGCLGSSLYGYRTQDTHRWARRVFFYSLFVLIFFSLSLALG
jgi:protoheme IX farnesyltransferase